MQSTMAREMVLKRIPYDVDRTLADLARAPLPAHVINGLAAVLGQGSVPA